MSTFKCTPPPSINAGLSSINVGVCASDWGKREVRAGSCLVEMIARQKERKVSIIIVNKKDTYFIIKLYIAF